MATLWVNLAPASYYDMAELRLLDLVPPAWLGLRPFSLTPLHLLTEALMALFVGLLAKELWEALILDRGALRGRQALFPLAMAAGGAAGGFVVWWLGGSLTAALAGPGGGGMGGAAGWTVTLGADVALCFVISRWIFCPGHPAIYLLLAVTLALDALGLLALALTTLDLSQPAEGMRPLWLALSAGAAVLVWLTHGRPPAPGASERTHRARQALWPYGLAAVVSWAGMVLAGLPGALGLLPVIPAIAHADRSFGLFAEVEGLLHDPLNRLTRLLVWPLVAVLFLFGLLRGGVDLAAFAPETLRLLASLWLGRPLESWSLGLALRPCSGCARQPGSGCAIW